ncbi:hypothetical protein HDU93_005992, partial [Gonapodya sp. JEL0774]
MKTVRSAHFSNLMFLKLTPSYFVLVVMTHLVVPPHPASPEGETYEDLQPRGEGFKLPAFFSNLGRRRSRKSTKSNKSGEEPTSPAAEIAALTLPDEDDSDEQRPGFFERIMGGRNRSRSKSSKRTGRSTSSKRSKSGVEAPNVAVAAPMAAVVGAAVGASVIKSQATRKSLSADEELILEETDPRSGAIVRRKLVKRGPPGAEVLELQDEPDASGFVQKRVIRRGDPSFQEYWELLVTETTTSSYTRRITKEGRPGSEYLVVEEDEPQPNGKVTTRRRI